MIADHGPLLNLFLFLWRIRSCNHPVIDECSRFLVDRRLCFLLQSFLPKIALASRCLTEGLLLREYYGTTTLGTGHRVARNPYLGLTSYISTHSLVSSF